MSKIVLFSISSDELKQLIREEVNRLPYLITRGQEKKGDQAEYVGAKEAAQFLGISLQTLYNKTSQGVIPHYKPKGSRKLTFKMSELTAYLEGESSLIDDLEADQLNEPDNRGL